MTDTLSLTTNLTEHTMSTTTSTPPNCAQPSRAAKAAVVFVAVLVGGALLGGLLGLFEMHSEDAAFTATAVHAQPSIGGLAMRDICSVMRG